MKKALVGTLILITLCIATYMGYTQLQNNSSLEEKNSKKQETSAVKENDHKEDDEVKAPDPITIIESNEVVTTIGDQYNYIKCPLVTDRSEIKIILYSHGSITYVTKDFTDPFMKDMQTYGNHFSDNGYIFAASNQHGANWGSAVAVNDMKLLVDYIKSTLEKAATEKGVVDYEPKYSIYLIGYSMGGLPTMNYTTTYPENVSKIALLAPTIYLDTWDKVRFDKIAAIPVEIWHGDKDVNVPWSLSNSFVNKATTNGKLVELNTLEGKTHWDIHTQYLDEILQFYEAE